MIKQCLLVKQLHMQTALKEARISEMTSIRHLSMFADKIYPANVKIR